MFLEKCKKCDGNVVIYVDAGDTPLCAFHYVKQEDEECLKASLYNEISLFGKINLPIEVQLEIKSQRPSLYKNLEDFFAV